MQGVVPEVFGLSNNDDHVESELLFFLGPPGKRKVPEGYD